MMREAFLAGQYWLQPLLALGVCSAGAACDSKLAPPKNVAATPATPTPAITVLRLVCDIPGELENPKRVVRGHIGWSDKNITTGEIFSFELAQPTIELPLKARIPLHEKIHVRFVVEGTPTFKTKFKNGDWFVYRKVYDESSRDVFVINLSSFRSLTRAYLRSIAPKITDGQFDSIMKRNRFHELY